MNKRNLKVSAMHINKLELLYNKMSMDLKGMILEDLGADSLEYGYWDNLAGVICYIVECCGKEISIDALVTLSREIRLLMLIIYPARFKNVICATLYNYCCILNEIRNDFWKYVEGQYPFIEEIKPEDQRSGKFEYKGGRFVL